MSSGEPLITHVPPGQPMSSVHSTQWAVSAMTTQVKPVAHNESEHGSSVLLFVTTLLFVTGLLFVTVLLELFGAVLLFGTVLLLDSAGTLSRHPIKPNTPNHQNFFMNNLDTSQVKSGLPATHNLGIMPSQTAVEE